MRQNEHSLNLNAHPIHGIPRDFNCWPLGYTYTCTPLPPAGSRTKPHIEDNISESKMA